MICEGADAEQNFSEEWTWSQKNETPSISDGEPLPWFQGWEELGASCLH